MKILKILKDLYANLVRTKWQLGFVLGGIETVMSNDKLDVTWVKSRYKDRWFADPFILNITDKDIILLVEEFPYSTKKGIISKLTISRKSFEITERKTILDLPTHLSFPNIYRLDDKIYIYPENCRSGKLDIYEYNKNTDELTKIQTICKDCIWDSCIVENFGSPKLFTAKSNDYFLDIYSWNKEKGLFENPTSIKFDTKTARMAGNMFEHNGSIYYPSQNCTKSYGQAVVIRKIEYNAESNKFNFEFIKELKSTHPTLKEGMHTLNSYKDIVVIDVIGYENPFLGKLGHKILKLIKHGRNN